MKLHFFTIMLSALTLVGCGASKTDTVKDTNSNTPLGQTYWVLEELDGQKISQAQEQDREIGFKLDPAENRVSGFAGCNSFFGEYRLEEGNRIYFSAFGATKMACPDSQFNEQEFLNTFSEATSYRIVGDRLELLIGKRAPLAVFKRKSADHATAITEKYWKLKTLEGQEVKMGKNQEREVYFMLKNEDNRVTGFAGCNNLMGTYSLEEGNRIRFSQMATTLMACPDVDFNESEFLKVFELADNYTISGNQLSLNVGRRAPLAVFEAVYMD